MTVLARLERRGSLAGALLLGALVVGVFGEFLVGDGERIPSHPTGDTAKYFVTARGFAVEQIRQGELPLWNPHTFSGTPFVGVFQSSVFYPTNVLHLLLPPGRAFSLEFALNLVLLGIFTFAWLRGWKLQWIAACFGALVVVFGGTCMLRVLAGQLSVLETFVWVPLVLLAIDRLADRPCLEWTLVGITGTSLMVLAGHPPTCLMAGLSVALYCVAAMLASGSKLRLLGCLACIPLGAGLVTAVQLWTGLQVAFEAARGSGISYDEATTYSMPPENLLTLVAPGFFGSRPFPAYFGRWWYWDASAAVGCGAVALAIHGAFASRRLTSRALALSAVLTVVALGRHTPIYRVLYDALPGLSFVRAPSKFMFFACLFVAGLAAVGADRLLREDPGDRRSVALTAGLGALVGALALWQWLAPAELGGLTLEAPTQLLAGLRPGGLAPASLARWDDIAVVSLLWATGLLVTSAALLWLAPGRAWAGVLLLGVGAGELVVFASSNHGAMPLVDPLATRPILQEAYDRAGERRVLEARIATNAAVAARGYNLWGYDPLFLHRYAEFIAFTQGRDISDLDNIRGHQPDAFHPLMSMLRVGLQAGRELVERPNPLPRALLLRSYRIETLPEDVLAALAEPGFDPRRHVILEQLPIPPPAATGGPSSIQLSDESSDRVRVEVELDTAGILVVTDAYAEGWEARALEDSSQRSYEVLRANAVLRAVPLQAGTHRFELVYSPLAFRAGAWTSAISCSVLLLLAGRCLYRYRSARAQGQGQGTPA